MRNSSVKSIVFIVLVLPILLLTGCGGGGGGGGGGAPPPPKASTIISGKAAAGAAIVGFVSVMDSSNKAQPVRTNIPIATDGSYSVDMSGLTPPFAFYATGTVGGKTVKYYSAAAQTDIGGKINITPFTDLMVDNIAGTIASTLSTAQLQGAIAGVTPQRLAAENQKLVGVLSPILQTFGLSASTDLLRGIININSSSGLNGLMDVIRVTSDPVLLTATLQNIVNNTAAVTLTPSSGIFTGTLPTGNISPTDNPIDQIRQTFQAFSAQFANGLPSPTSPGLVGLFSANFMDGGQSRDSFLGRSLSDPALVGADLGNGLVFDSVDTTNGVAQVRFVPRSSTGQQLVTENQGVISWQMERVNNQWLLNGDQHIVFFGAQTLAKRAQCNPANVNCAMQSPLNFTGLSFHVDLADQQSAGLAIIKGPGLPSAGLVHDRLSGTELQGNYSSGDCFCSALLMTDGEIGALGSGPFTYTVEVYGKGPNPSLLATYQNVVPNAPTLNANLPSKAFPSLTGLADLNNFAGGTLTPIWSVPSGLVADEVVVFLSSFGDFVSVRQERLGTGSGVATLVVRAPSSGSWDSGHFLLKAIESDGGRVDGEYR